MSLKTLLFNKSIIKSDLKRFWWISALGSIAVFVCCVLPLLYNSQDIYSVTEEFAYNDFLNIVTFSAFWVLVFSICTPILLFSYLYNAGSVSCIHGLPLKRKTLYFSHLITGFFLLMVPVFVNSVILCILKFTVFDINYVVKFNYILKWIFQYALYTIIVYSGTTFVCMLTGNAIASLVLSVIAGLMPVFVLGSADFFLGQNFYGYYSKNLLSYTRNIYLMPRALLTSKCFIYIIAGIAAAGLGYILYKKRRLENYGEVLAFNSLKPIFIFCVALCSGLLGYMYFNGLTNITSTFLIFVMIPFGLVGLVIAFMLSKRAFTLKGIFKHAAVYVVFVAALFAVVKFDITGFEKRVPSEDEVASVSIIDQQTISKQTYYEGESYTYDEIYNAEFTSQQDIANVIAYHKSKIANRELDENATGRNIPIIYTLKNGKKIYRSYTASYSDEKSLLAPLMESDAYKGYLFPITDGTEQSIDNITISIFGDSTESIVKKDEISKIREALIKDIKTLKFDDFSWAFDRQSDCPLTLNVNYNKPATSANGKKLDLDKMSYSLLSDTYYISDKYVNTLEVLKELGYKTDIKSENIDKIGINISEYYLASTYADVASTSAYSKSHSADDDEYFNYTTVDKNEISQIADYARSAYKNAKNGGERISFNITFFMNDGSTYNSYISFGYEDMPQIFQNVINYHYSK